MPHFSLGSEPSGSDLRILANTPCIIGELEAAKDQNDDLYDIRYASKECFRLTMPPPRTCTE